MKGAGASGGREPLDRDPDAFRFSTHLEHDILEDEEERERRHINRDLIRETIERGNTVPGEGGEGRVKRKLNHDGVERVVIIDPDAMVVVTAWSEVKYWPEARRSDRWSNDDLLTIVSFMRDRRV